MAFHMRGGLEQSKCGCDDIETAWFLYWEFWGCTQGLSHFGYYLQSRVRATKMTDNVNQHEKLKYLGKPRYPWTQTSQEYKKNRRLEDSRRPRSFAVSDQENTRARKRLHTFVSS